MSPVDSQQAEETKRQTWLRKIRVFLLEVKQELKMTTFPTWPDVRAQVIMVLIFILIVSAYVITVDLICQRYLDPLIFRR